MKQRFRNEYEGARLGDSRRSERLSELGSALAVFPAASFPSSLGDGAELEAAYRFLKNAAVDAQGILEPHHRETADRCTERCQVVVAHDTTDFRFTGKRRGLGRLRTENERGFLSHFGLAVSSDSFREPLGVLNLESWTRQKKVTESFRHRQRNEQRESTRWLRGIERAEERLQAGSAIHVMDREADAYDLFAALIAKQTRFVIRLKASDRRLVKGETLNGIAGSQKVVLKREVALSARKPSPFRVQRKIHPPRNARIATLAIKAFPVTTLRPHNLTASHPESVCVNVVIVEESAPPQGEQPVVWRLCTTESIATTSDVERIIDAYRCRWRIEEFFRALKSGCAIQKRQLETCRGLMNAVAVFTPIAWRALRHRTLAQEDEKRTASKVLTKLQIRILRKKSKAKLERKLSVADALVAIAALGGHLKRNGPPGWITLSRGYERLLALEEGALLAAEM